jgi:hypothetical protein
MNHYYKPLLAADAVRRMLSVALSKPRLYILWFLVAAFVVQPRATWDAKDGLRMVAHVASGIVRCDKVLLIAIHSYTHSHTMLYMAMHSYVL